MARPPSPFSLGFLLIAALPAGVAAQSVSLTHNHGEKTLLVDGGSSLGFRK